MSSETRDADLEFIKDNWGRLSATAWKGFQQKGKGAVFIHTAGGTQLDSPQTKLTIVYAGEQGSADWGPVVKRMLEEYDPAKQVVFYIGQKHDKRVYRLGMKPYPPAAYKQLQNEP